MVLALFLLCCLILTPKRCFYYLLEPMHPHKELHQWRQGQESGGQAKELLILPLTVFLLCISGDGDVDGRQSICDDVELIFFRFCSWEGSISLVMGKPETGCLYLAYCRASMIHLISRQTSSVCFGIKWWKALKEIHFPESIRGTIFLYHWFLWHWFEPYLLCL